MPECWHEFFAVGRSLRLSDLKKNEAGRKRIQRKFGREADGEGYLCVRVLPMGWISAVGIMQAIHRGLMLQEPPFGAGLKPGEEIKKTGISLTGRLPNCAKSRASKRR